MKVLFAVSNEGISDAIIKKYQQMYKEIISSKNVYYFNAIMKELQKDKTYDRIVISEDLEPFANNNYDTIDNFLFEKLDSISDEASNNQGEDIPIILISTDRRAKGENILVKLFGIGIYSTIIGEDRSIENVCQLIHKPRSKKEAKMYYRIASNEVEYKPESEGDVSETEIQNILAHYKRLGKNEEKYVESFNRIASQYNDEQLKLIAKFLPLNVKAILEESCPKYQQIMTFGETTKPATSRTKVSSKKVKNMPPESGIKIESIIGENGKAKLTKPVVIPSEVKEINAVNTAPILPEQKFVKSIQKVGPFTEVPPVQPSTKQEQPIIETTKSQPQVVQPVEKKRGRGRPKKQAQEDIVTPVETVVPQVMPQETPIAHTAAPKRRGRPRKTETAKPEPILPGFEEIKQEAVLPGFEEIEQEEPMLPGFEEVQKQEPITSPVQNRQQNSILPGFEDFEEEEEQEEAVLPGFEEISEPEPITVRERPMTTEQPIYRPQPQQVQPQPIDRNPSYRTMQQSQMEQGIPQTNLPYGNSMQGNELEALTSRDRKIVGFVGTSKNGTSFLVNNLAQLLSEQGIKTAILDLTANKNAYYIYTKNEEELRQIAFHCMNKLGQGMAQGIQVNRNLDVYTSLPGEEATEALEAQNVLNTLAQNYSLVLVDCDFKTDYNYIRYLQELYLVQSMDVLTIQPLTAYLRDLKAKGILDPHKLRIVINQYAKVRSVTEKTIIGGMAYYNDPSMSFMTELFNRDTIKYVVIPFDVTAYTKYLEGLVNCNISLNGYSKEMINYLKKLANMVYPLISDTQKYGNPKKKQKNNYQPYNNYGKSFSNEMNETLNKMKNI